MSDRKNREQETDLIEEPSEVDVLCGRGGMSNHHPGNEWYRRLIRSNRPLYRACPKHTKLLVSKAIVQAVEQQGGRFLEKDRRSNLFVKVPYKRAVDKTSQGLRERDRDDDDDDDDEDESGESERDESERGEGKKRKRMVVPEEFSGRNKNPNMSELATVAIGMTSRRNNSPMRSGGSIKRAKVEVVVGKKSRANLLADDDDDDDDDDEKEDSRRVESASHAVRRIQLPPPLHTNQTSTFRLLNQPTLSSQKSSVAAGSVPEASPAFLPTFSQAFGMPQPPGVQSSVSQPFHPAVPGIYWVNPASPNPVAFLPLPLGTDSAPPPLSRLTSQVSDWLTSFWPVSKESQQANSQSGSSDANNLPPAISNQIKIPAPLGNDKPQINTVPPPAKRIVHIQQQRLHQKQRQAKAVTQDKESVVVDRKAGPAVEAKRPAQVVSQQQAQLEAWQRFQAQQVAIREQYERHDDDFSGAMGSSNGHDGEGIEEDYRMYEANPSRKPVARASGGFSLDYPSGNKRNGNLHRRSTSADDDDAKLAAEPTDLEHSVSATLLKLASGGRLESGITTFFERQQSMDVMRESDQTDEFGSGTLLDDHQDTEAERRLRLI